MTEHPSEQAPSQQALPEQALVDEAFAASAFSSLSPVEPSAGLLRRVAELPIVHPRAKTRLWPFQSLWMPLLAGVLAAALGITTGLATLETDGPSATTAASSSEDSVDDLLVLAWGNEPAAWHEQLSLENP